MIPQIILVTGFLGSGKTTLVNRLIRFYGSNKLGVIINDFGKISVDGILIKKVIESSNITNVKIHEIANGSIFCSCLSSEFVKTLKLILEINPEYIIIESSGLSDPSSLRKILIDNNVNEMIDLSYIICLIDPLKTMKLASNLIPINKQIVNSNILVINKIDLISNDEFKEIESHLNSLNKNAKIIKSVYSDIDLSKLDQKFNHFDNLTVDNKTYSNIRPKSIILEPKEISFEQLKEFYTTIKDEILRIKGFLVIEDNQFYISDNNNQLLIEICEYKTKETGLSLLAYNENINLIENKWNKIIKKVSNNE